MKNTHSFSVTVLTICTLFLCLIPSQAQLSLLQPEKQFGFMPGSDYNLFTYEELTDYLMKLDRASPMVAMEEIGESPMGRTM